MQVIIGGQQFSYISDYSPANRDWKIQAGAAFRFPVIIGGKACFIKRFTSPPPGLGLLLALKGFTQTSPLPIIYDVINVSEYNQTVTYLFMELIEGDTLDNIITQRLDFHSRKLTDGLLECLQVIHDRGYWFSDLCEKNIFFDKRVKRYTLIDLDSCEPMQNRPSPVPNTPGYIPGQEFAAAVVDFYTQILRIPNFTFGTLTGKQLNLLQLVPLVAKLELFVKAVNAQPNFVYRSSNFPKLQEYIVGKKPAYSQAIFTKVLQNQVTKEMITMLCGVFASKYGAAFEPQIISFKVKPTQAEVGDTVTFSWETLNAEKIEIKASDGSFVQKNLLANDSWAYVVTKGQRFRLVADTASEIVDVRLIPPPKIKKFEAARTQIYFGEKVALNWEIEGRPKQVSLTEYNQAGQIIWSDNSVVTKGAKAFTPLNISQTYILDIGTARQEILIRTTPKPNIVYLIASPSTVVSNQASELSWKVDNVSTVHLYQRPNSKNSKILLGTFGPIQAAFPISVTETTTYSIEASTLRKEVTVTVLQPRIVYFKITTDKITFGQSVTLSWNVENTKDGQLIEIDSAGNERIITADLSNSGNITLTPAQNLTYRLTIGLETEDLTIQVSTPWGLPAWLEKYWQRISITILLLCMLSLLFTKIGNTIKTTNVTTTETQDSISTTNEGNTNEPVDENDVLQPNEDDMEVQPKTLPAQEDQPQEVVETPLVVDSPTDREKKQDDVAVKNDKAITTPTQENKIADPVIPASDPEKVEGSLPPSPYEINAGEGMKWRKENGLWALYDTYGNRKTPAKYKFPTNFRAGKATVQENLSPLRLTIDKEGNIISN